METLTATRLYTYEDLQALDNGNRYELIDGELIVHDNPNVAHQRTVFKLLYNLVQYVRTNKIGEVFPAPLDVRLGPATIVQPDLLVVLAANASRVQNIIEGPPDWVC